MKPGEPSGRLPLIPRLVLGGLAILLLSWLFFMTQYVLKVSRQPRVEAPPRQVPVATTNAPIQRR